MLDCSKTDEKIGTYILEYLDHIPSLSIHELAKKLGVSTASISRFSTKLGIRSFKDFKLEIVRYISITENNESTKFGNDIINRLTWEMSYNDLTNQMVNEITSVCSAVFSLNTQKMIDDVTKELEEAETIYFIAMGASILPTRDLQHKLMRLRKRCIFLEDTNYGLQNIVIATPKDAIVAISYDGKSPKVINSVKKAILRGVKVISITKNSTNRLRGLSDYNLRIPNIALTDASLSSIFRRYSQLMVTDIIYISLSKRVYNNPENELQIYNEEVKQLNHR